MSGAYNDSLDNSEVPIKEDKKNLMPGFESEEQARLYKLYLENLKLMHELTATALGDKTLSMQVGTRNGKKLTQEVALKNLVPRESEFDRIRKVTIARINRMTDEDLRRWMSRFGTDNIFVLSGRIAAYLLDKKKRDEAYSNFNVWGNADENADDSFHGAGGGDGGDGGQGASVGMFGASTQKGD